MKNVKVTYHRHVFKLADPVIERIKHVHTMRTEHSEGHHWMVFECRDGWSRVKLENIDVITF